jgi:glycosyltransferase involved in cell wall biosynthesis
MKIIHITPTFYPAIYWGGPIYSVYDLCNSTAKIPDVILRVLTTDSASPRCSDALNVTDFPISYPGGFLVFFCRRWWAHSFSPGMLLRLWPMIKWADVVHLTAVYSPPTIPTLLICRMLGKPIIWSPRGALQSWDGSTKPLVKRLWVWICNVLISRERCVMHFTSSQEILDSKAWVPNSDSVLIPNSVNLPQVLSDRSWLPDGKLRLLFIGRLHPKKGVENLLYALKLIGDEMISLMICGIGEEAYSRTLRALVNQLSLEKCVSFKGHVDSNEKMNVFMQSDVCVVPSFTENFGRVVTEALAHGVPVIAGKGTPWEKVQSHDCGLWVENDPESLAKAILCIRAKVLPEMGERGRNWMKEDFCCSEIAAKMHSTYKNLIKHQLSN